MAPARKQNLRAGISKARAGRCRARAHDGHAQAWRTHVRNIYAHTKGFVDVGFVDVQCNRQFASIRAVQVYGYGQIWCHRIALWCCICHASMLNALPFCRPKNVSSRSLLAATYWLRSGAARPIANARGLKNSHTSKAQVYGPAPGTDIPRSC